jgi:hypothetical protein
LVVSGYDMVIDMSELEKNSVIASEDEDTSKKDKSLKDDKDSRNKVGITLELVDIVILF